MEKKLIIRLAHSNNQLESLEGVKINKLVSSISPINFIRLLHDADNKVNPRTANVNRITKSIHETLEKSPELYWLKSKGLLLATESCRVLERNRIEVTLGHTDFEGIMDGGHNAFAIAIYLIEKLFDESIKKWDDCKAFWNENYDEILKRFESRKDEFKFSIPIEIVMPNQQDGSIEEFYENVSEICSARNNNIQLTETAKGNQVGNYDYLKSILDSKFDIIWKSGDSGKIKPEDVISLACLPLIFLQDNNLLPEDIKKLNKISIYSQKSRCVDFFNSVLEHESISEERNGKYNLNNNYVRSALNLCEDILMFFDRMYIEFPSLYQKAVPGKFGRISSVTKKENPAPFFSSDQKAMFQYSHGFFYPLVSGLTQLMTVDEETETVSWNVNPSEIGLEDLDLSQYVSIIKLVFFDPQKIGKGDVFYKEAETVFDKIPV